MSGVNAKLQGPLRQIAKLALEEEPSKRHVDDQTLDLSDLRAHIGNNTQDVIVAFLRQEVERLSDGKKSVRSAPNLARKVGPSSVGCAVVPGDTPECEVVVAGRNMFGFVVGGTRPGYITF